MVQESFPQLAKDGIKLDTKSEDLMQIFALLTASLVTFTFGTLFAWPSPTIPILLSPDYNMTIEETSYLTIVAPLSMALWTPVFCKLIDAIGRKYTILSISVLHITAWLLVAFANKTYYLYAISRFVSGMADANCMATVPTYIAEVTTPRVRDVYGNLIMLAIFVGQFLVNCVGYYCSIQTTAYIFLTFPIVFAIIFTFMPESPYYSCMKGQYGKAEASLQMLYRKKDVGSELTQISNDVKRQMSETGRFKDLWIIRSNRRALIIINTTRTFQQLSGITAFLAYAQHIFQQMGSDISSGVAAMIFNGLMAACCLIGNIIADKLGKTFALVVSFVGSGIPLLVVTIYFYLEIYTDTNVAVASYVPVIGLIVFIISYSLGLASIPTILTGEIFSSSIKGKGIMIANIVFALYTAGTNKLFQYLMTTFGLCVPFFLFSICCFIGAIVTYFIVPNTQGKTLEEIQQILKGNKV